MNNIEFICEISSSKCLAKKEILFFLFSFFFPQKETKRGIIADIYGRKLPVQFNKSMIKLFYE